MPHDVDPRYALTVLGGVAIGAAAMYVLDPDKGKRRRAIVRDRTHAVVADTRQALGAAARDASHRIEGLRARAARVLGDAPIPDDLQLIERVRARMGRLVSHPHAIQVGANRGRVTLSGPVLRREVERLRDSIRTVWGVSELEDRLVVYDTAESISSLQDGAPAPRRNRHAPRENWPPALRAAALLTGTALSLYGTRRRSLAGCALIGAGLLLALRGVTNTPVSRLIGQAPLHASISPAADPSMAPRSASAEMPSMPLPAQI